MLPDPHSFLGASAGWDAVCGLGQAYKGGPVGLRPWACAPIALSLLSQSVWLTDGHPPSGRSREVRVPRCVGQETPIPTPKGGYGTHQGWATACVSGKGDTARTRDSSHRQLSCSSQLHKRTGVQRGWERRRWRPCS